MIAKNDLVLFVHQHSGIKDVGFVQRRAAKSMSVLYDDGGLRAYSIASGSGHTPEQLIEALKVIPVPSGTTIPLVLQQLKDESNITPVKKGAIVGFSYDGEERTGRVMNYPQLKRTGF